MIAGGNNLYDMTVEVAGYNAGYLFLDRGIANLVVNGHFVVKWFKNIRWSEALIKSSPVKKPR